jgi:hypothetical protein
MGIPIDADGRLRQLVELTCKELLGSSARSRHLYWDGSVGRQLKSEEESRKKSLGHYMIPKKDRIVSEEFLESVSRDIKMMLIATKCDIKQSGIKAKRILEAAIKKQFEKPGHAEDLEHNMKLSEEIRRRYEHVKQTIEDTLSDIQLGLVDNPVQAIRKLKETRW